MNKVKYLFPLLFSFLLLCCLYACTNTSVDDDSEQPVPDSQKQEETDPSKNTNETAGIHLSLPNGICADICNSIPSDELTVQLSESDSSKDATALLNGTVDLALLSPQSAAELYRSGQKVQIVAVVSLGDPELLDSMECLVGCTDYLKNQETVVAKFILLYQQTAQENSIDDAILITGWDMLDLVQQNLELQFEKQPNLNQYIPDQNFFYIPS